MPKYEATNPPTIRTMSSKSIGQPKQKQVRNITESQAGRLRPYQYRNAVWDLVQDAREEDELWLALRQAQSGKSSDVGYTFQRKARIRSPRAEIVVRLEATETDDEGSAWSFEANNSTDSKCDTGANKLSTAALKQTSDRHVLAI